MKKTIYLVRHSSPFVEYENKLDWNEYNKNMILSVEGEENAKKLINIEELNNIDKLYSANSFRAIATAKYIAHQNNIKINIDNRINERIIGIKKLDELPNNFNVNQFNNKNYKLDNGESLNEVSHRFNNFINEVLNSNYKKIVLSIHGIVLMNYISEHTNFKFDGKNFKAIFNNKEIINGMLTSPDIYKIEYNNLKIVNITRILI